MALLFMDGFEQYYGGGYNLANLELSTLRYGGSLPGSWAPATTGAWAGPSLNAKSKWI